CCAGLPRSTEMVSQGSGAGTSTGAVQYGSDVLLRAGCCARLRSRSHVVYRRRSHVEWRPFEDSNYVSRHLASQLTTSQIGKAREMARHCQKTKFKECD